MLNFAFATAKHIGEVLWISLGQLWKRNKQDNSISHAKQQWISTGKDLIKSLKRSNRAINLNMAQHLSFKLRYLHILSKFSVFTGSCWISGLLILRHKGHSQFQTHQRADSTTQKLSSEDTFHPPNVVHPLANWTPFFAKICWSVGDFISMDAGFFAAVQLVQQ